MITVIRLERVKTGQTLRKFSRQYGLSETTLSRIERGNQYVPPQWRDVLANALQLGIDDICDQRGWPKWTADTKHQSTASVSPPDTNKEVI